jgi:hypothetical protein
MTKLSWLSLAAIVGMQTISGPASAISLFGGNKGQGQNLPDAAALEKATARFAPTELKVDLSSLPPSERAALAEILEAARIVDSIFLRQSWSGSLPALLELQRDQSRLGRARLHAFMLNKGPWDSLDGKAFLPNVPDARPESAAFYPPGTTKVEVESWQAKLPASVRTRATSFFTTIRRDVDGRYTPVPYAIEYQGELAQAAWHLKSAAAKTENATLKLLLESRAAAFQTDDYYDSDLAWMQLDSPIDPVIGPYEVYMDGWFNAKAAFESFIGVKDADASAKLLRLSGELQAIENALPEAPELRNPKLGALAPIAVVNEIFCSGDANHGVQTAAFNLPNDERIQRERGTKRVMLKNVQEAKFEKTLLPIAKLLMDGDAKKKMSFDAFFTHILMHELVHGLGPHTLANGKTVRELLQEADSALEEAKADVGGLWALQQLIDRGVLDKQLEDGLYTTYLASGFRTMRFGLAEAHAKGMALQLNALLDGGAIAISKKGLWSIDGAKAKVAIANLLHDLLTVQAGGDAAAARAFLTQRAQVRPEVKAALDKLGGVPIDIEPIFTTADALR